MTTIVDTGNGRLPSNALVSADTSPSVATLVDQLDLFPERVSVERMDARSAGPRSRVRDLYVVRFERDPAAHQVFHDRHGWYCAEHGPGCRAVGVARSA